MRELIGANIIGDSIQIKNVIETIGIYAQYPAPVLITGETGTGKELVARGLHYSGKFSGKPFIALNCSTFSDELFISELFGYKKGAFTDAKNDHKGLLHAADGGTIFLDEIDTLSLKSQAALLRLLQECEYRPVGSSSNQRANVRFIAAANSNLPELIANGKFREDLYYRLFILTVHMPPLRERRGDIQILSQFFITKLNQQYNLDRREIDQKVLSKLCEYQWPGNVRELENTIHRLYLTASGSVIDNPEAINNNVQLHERVVAEPGAAEQPLSTDVDTLSFSEAKKLAVESFESQYITRLLKTTDGNVTKAASLCGKERRAFGKLVKKYSISKSDY